MPLSKDDRIAFSKKIVSADLEIAAIETSKAQILTQKAQAEKLDLAHKNLVDDKNIPINGYQGEITLLDGNVRTTVTESDIQDSANFVIGNAFYPNNLSSLPPSIAPAIWTKTKPYALGKAIGKTVLEAFAGTTTKESDLVGLVSSAISAIETSYVTMERVTGQQCTNPGGTCSLPIYTTQPTCIAGGGVWTPGVDTIATYPAVQNALTDLVTKVNNLKNFLISMSASLFITDTNTTRKNETLTAKNNIDNVIIPAINTWLAYTSFNTAHGQTTCIGFYGYNSNSLGSTKLRATELNALKAALATRGVFVTTRTAQLQGYLGSINQDLSTGDVTGAGLYFERYSFIKIRLNLMGGSLTSLKGFDRAVTAQDEQKASILSAKATYQVLMVCAALAAPANGTKYVSLKSAAGLSVGDSLFIITDTQEELVRTIEQVNGNRILLGQEVSAKYKESDFGRVYKLL
jgi:hypothetical protein